MRLLCKREIVFNGECGFDGGVMPLLSNCVPEAYVSMLCRKEACCIHGVKYQLRTGIS